MIRVSCLNFSLEVHAERVKARDVICGQNETIRDLSAQVSSLDATVAAEREMFWAVASELELLKFQENLRVLNA